MRKISILVMFSLLAQKGLTQSVTIDPRNATNKIIEMKSTSGGILIPRMTSVQRNNIQSLPEGLLVYDTDIKSFFFVQSGVWKGIFGEISLPYSGTYNMPNASGFSLLNNENSMTANAGKFEAPYGIGIHGIGGDIAGKFISAGGRGIYAEGAIAGEFYGGNGIGVKIDVNGNNYNSLVIPRGRVGIGTLTPSTLFQVKGSINDYLWETTANETPNTSDITVGLRVNQQYTDMPETAKVLFGTKSDHALNFFTNDNHGSPDMTVYNGKIGINLTEPAFPLSINGKTAFYKDNVYAGEVVGNTNGDLVINSNNAKNINLQSNVTGNVGIGDSEPIAKLTVSKGSAGTALFRGSNFNSSFMVGTEEDIYLRGGKVSSKLFLNNAPNQTGSIHIGDENNAVNIGSTNVPYSKLTVTTSGDSKGLTHTNDNVVFSTFVGRKSNDNIDAAWLGTESGHPLNFYTEGGPAQMTILTHGNIGIGTTEPNARLHVAGNIRADEGIYSEKASGLNIAPLGVIHYSLEASPAHGASGASFRFHNYEGYTGNIVGSLFNGASEAQVTIDTDDYIDGKLFLYSEKLQGYSNVFLTTNYNISQNFDPSSITPVSSINGVSHELKRNIPNSDDYIAVRFILDSLDYLRVEGTIMVYGIR